MNEEPIRETRSPRGAPMMDLESAVAAVGKIHAQGRTAPLPPEAAVKAMNYSGLNGAALTTLASLTHYGLVDRPGGRVAVTPLAVRILHPKSDEQRLASLREAALLPKAFSETITGYEDCSADVIAAHLIQVGYVKERAKKVAKIYTDNKLFARLHEAGNVPEEQPPAKEPVGTSSNDQPPGKAATPTISPALPEAMNQPKMLAQYSIPLGANQATLSFIGETLTAEDFDALVDFVQFTKRQFERASGNAFEVRYISLADLDRKLSTLKERHPSKLFDEKTIAKHRERAMKLDNDGESVGSSITFSLRYLDT